MQEIKFSEFLYVVGLVSKESKVVPIGGESKHITYYKFNEFALYFDSDDKMYKKWADKYLSLIHISEPTRPY